MSFLEILFFIEKFVPDPLSDGPEMNYITPLLLIFSHSQLLVLFLFYALGNPFLTLKLSYDVVHFRPILEEVRDGFFDEKQNFKEAHETHIDILGFSSSFRI